MQNLMFRYTRHMNRRHGRVGHLFQGRFRSVLVDEQSYLLELVRCIHLNPVRARGIREPFNDLRALSRLSLLFRGLLSEW